MPDGVLAAQREPRRDGYLTLDAARKFSTGRKSHMRPEDLTAPVLRLAYVERFAFQPSSKQKPFFKNGLGWVLHKIQRSATSLKSAR
jgi:hypothetical protein